MYSVYRCENGRQKLVLTHITRLERALAEAKALQSRVVGSDVRYRVYGPPPRQRGLQNDAAHARGGWYDPVPPPHQPTSRNQPKQPAPPPEQASRAAAAPGPKGDPIQRPNATAKARTPSVKTVEERVYSVVSHRLNQKRVLVSNIRSRAKADACAHDFRAQSRDSSEVILVNVEVRRVTVTPQPQRRTRSPRGVAANMNRPYRGKPAGDDRGRRRFDPATTERRGDISLVTRSEEEMGLGIPAQWGKGRSHRKGDYIP